MKARIYKELSDKYEKLIAAKVYTSWLSFLRTCYDVASEKKQYKRCSIIQDLIREDIGS